MSYKSIIFIMLLTAFGCSSTKDYRYEVHLIDGGGTHHLITAGDEYEAEDFVDEYEDSHGTMKILKLKN